MMTTTTRQSLYDSFPPNNDILGLNEKKENRRHHGVQFHADDNDNDQQQLSSRCDNEFSRCNNFFADSPYYHAFVEKEMNSIGIISDTMLDIASKTARFVEAGEQMAAATRDLAMSCKLEHKTKDEDIDDNGNSIQEKVEETKKVLGTETYNVIHSFGKVLDEMAAAQEKLYRSVESTMGLELKEYMEQIILETDKLKDGALSQTETAEQMFHTYLMTKQKETTSGGGLKNIAGRSLLNKIASSSEECKVDSTTSSSSNIMLPDPLDLFKQKSENVDRSSSRMVPVNKQLKRNESSRLLESQRSGLSAVVQPLKRPDSWHSQLAKKFTLRGSSSDQLSSSSNNNEKQQNSYFNNAESKINSSLSKSSSTTSDLLHAKALEMAKCKLTLEQIRVNQITAELKRFDLAKHLIITKNQTKAEISKNTAELHQEVGNYFLHCSRVAQEMMPCLQETEKELRQCAELHRSWKQKEDVIIQILTKTRDAALNAKEELEDLNRAGSKGTRSRRVHPKTLRQEYVEKKTQIWNLPKALTMTYRAPAPGVTVEGWLYQKTSSLISLQPWNKQWYVLKNGEIYSLQSDSKTGSATITTKAKVCDVVLSTVREVPEDAASSGGSARFQFELHVSNQRPITFMARGPHDYKMWVDGIRSAIATELTRESHSQSLNRNIGLHRLCSGIRVTVMEKSFKTILEDDLLHEEEDECKNGLSDSELSSSNALIDQVMKTNCTCADCGKASPDWVSLNLGILVCIDCSGVHRSLGVHVSKVRSLTLDSLSDREARLFLSLGNDRVNGIFQKAIEHDTSTQLESNADRDVREDWIHKKYVEKHFLGPCNEFDNNSDDGTEVKNEAVRKAAEEGDVLRVARALAYGGLIETTIAEDSALHHALVGLKQHNNRENALNCIELLLQNGAKANLLSKEDQDELNNLLNVAKPATKGIENKDE